EDALAVGLRAYDLGSSAVLQSSGDDLGRRRRPVVDEDDHRDAGRDRVVPGIVDPGRPTALLGGHDLAVLDEDAGHVDRLANQAAAVCAQVEYQGLGAIIHRGPHLGTKLVTGVFPETA